MTPGRPKPAPVGHGSGPNSDPSRSPPVALRSSNAASSNDARNASLDERLVARRHQRRRRGAMGSPRHAASPRPAHDGPFVAHHRGVDRRGRSATAKALHHQPESLRRLAHAARPRCGLRGDQPASPRPHDRRRLCAVHPHGEEPVRGQHRRRHLRQPVPVRSQHGGDAADLSVGLAAPAVAIRAPVGHRFRPLEARRGRRVLRLVGAVPRHRPSPGRAHRRPRPHGGVRHVVRLPRLHRPAAHRVPAHARRRRGDLVARPGDGPQSTHLSDHPRPGHPRTSRRRRLQRAPRRADARLRHCGCPARRPRRPPTRPS